MNIEALSVILLVVVTGSQGQSEGLDIWALGRQPYRDGECVKEGMNIAVPGLPEFEDPWFLLAGTCDTYQGSVGCENEQLAEGKLRGKCLCNQGEDQEFDWDLQYCVGKVGAICTAEHTSFIPEKKCVPNSHCIPEQGEGHSVGTCTCVDGYVKTDERKCDPDPDVGDEDRGTPRTPTTTVAPPREKLELPSLNLLNGFNSFEDECLSEAMLNRTFCKNYQGTVSCIDRRCQCNMAGDAIFDEQLNLCVGLTGSYCLTRSTLLGWKACTNGADCFVEDGTTSNKFSFGTCKCLFGYNEEEDGTCTRNPNIINPSTKRPGGPRGPTTTTVPGTTDDNTGTEPTSTKPTTLSGTRPTTTPTTPTTSQPSSTTEAGASTIADFNRITLLIAIISLTLFSLTHS